MATVVYSAEARVTGGRLDGQVRTSDGFELRLGLPKQLGGDGNGANPEQLFAIGYAACFEASMLVAAQRLGVSPESVADASIDSKVALMSERDGRFGLDVELDLSLPSVPDPVVAAELIRTTYGICAYSNAISGNVDVALSVNGAPVEIQQASELSLPEITERYFAAWEARDPDAIVALHTPDTVFWSHAGMDPVEGRDAVRETFAQLFEQFPQFGFEVYRVIHGESHWVLDWKLTFDGPGGERLGFDCMDMVEVAPDGLVARKDTFVDLVQLQALALEPNPTAAAA